MVADARIANYLSGRLETLPWRRKRAERWLKRAADFVVAGILLLPLAPVIGLTALAVRLTSPGPVLLAQKRLGLYGVPFKMYKFRSMRADTADGLALGGGEVTTADARLTPIGGWLRAWRIDELPQLWHVLVGEMSLVGPRPDLPENLQFYAPEQLLRFAMPQGCTAWTFTRGAFDNDWSTRQSINVEYVEQWSFGLDVNIMLNSAVVLLRQKATSPATNATPQTETPK
jgi:lipopolysaccharide/colanic/teichoic acid biosynthesis glycosyltransferase